MSTSTRRFQSCNRLNNSSSGSGCRCKIPKSAYCALTGSNAVRTRSLLFETILREECHPPFRIVETGRAVMSASLPGVFSATAPCRAWLAALRKWQRYQLRSSRAVCSYYRNRPQANRAKSDKRVRADTNHALAEDFIALRKFFRNRVQFLLIFERARVVLIARRVSPLRL